MLSLDDPGRSETSWEELQQETQQRRREIERRKKRIDPNGRYSLTNTAQRPPSGYSTDGSAHSDNLQLHYTYKSMRKPTKLPELPRSKPTESVNLREAKYGKVPPVPPRTDAFVRTPDDEISRTETESARQRRKKVYVVRRQLPAPLPLIPEPTPRRSQHVPERESKRGGGYANNEPVQRFMTSDRFALGYVERFCIEMMDDEILPDLLIEAISELAYKTTTKTTTTSTTNRHPYSVSAVCEELINEVARREVRILVKEIIGDMVDSYLWRGSQEQSSEQWIQYVIQHEVTEEMAREVVRATVRELVMEHFEQSVLQEIASSILNEVITEQVPLVMEDTIESVVVLGEYNMNLLDPVLKWMIPEVAAESLEQAVQEAQESETNEIRELAERRVLLELITEVLLQAVRVDGQKLASAYEETALDGYILDELLHVHAKIERQRAAVLDNYPLAKKHRELFTEAATETVLDALAEALDQELSHLDALETG